MVKIAIVGAGGIASQHIQCLMSIKEARIAAVVDAVPERAQRAAEQCGARAYDKLESCLDTVDAVYVLTPPKSHVGLCLEVIQAGKHLFVEKPLADTVEHAETIVSAADQAGIKAMTAFNMRFRKGFRRLKEVFDSGVLGEPVSYWCQRLGIGVGNEPNWRTTQGQIVGMTVESLSHDIDLIRWMLGDVRGVATRLSFTRPELPAFDDHASALFKLESGASAVIHASWSSHLGLNSRGIVGTNGTALVEGDGLWELTRFRLKTNDMEYEVTEKLNDLDNRPSYFDENVAFIESIVRGKPLPATLQDGLQAVRIAEAMHRSHRDQREIELS